MATVSASKSVDDVKLHLELVLQADDARRAAEPGETEAARVQRQSAVLRAPVRARVEASLGLLREVAPGLSGVETTKLLKTRAGRDALRLGQAALGRVDDHLQSVTGQRNPLEGKRYGVYGDNPTSFTGVLRSLGLSKAEDARVRALPEGDADRELAFSEFIAGEVLRAYAGLSALVGERVTSRADLTRAVSAKDETVLEAVAALTAVRAHLYANLPDRKQDDDLREYGFDPIEPSGRASGRKGGEPDEPKPAPTPDGPKG